MYSQKAAFKQYDFMLIKQAFTALELEILSQQYDQLFDRAKSIITVASTADICLGDFYHDHPEELIVVPEVNHSLEPCRFEYIAHCSKVMNEQIIHKAQCLIEDLMGEPFILFKDKCNVKNPGGGAFPPHQDITAYYHFQPKFHITAAVILDTSTIANGCLEMATDYKEHLAKSTRVIHNRFGKFPFFDFYQGGARNGDIHEDISMRFNWVPMEANPGDILLFNSFVPHRSQKNTSKSRRRNFFFTFNAASEGDWYRHYYQLKKQDFNNPIFHVSTPTKHSGYDQ